MEGAVGNTAAANVTNMVECKICIIESSVCRFSELGEADRAHDKLVRLSNCTEMSRQVIKLYRTFQQCLHLLCSFGTFVPLQDDYQNI